MNRSRINGILFDFGRVLGNFDKMGACAQFAESSPYSAKQIHDIIVDGNLERMLESGKMSSNSFARELLNNIKSDMTVPDLERIWGNIFSPNPEIDPYVAKFIDRKVRLGVLSNTNEIHWPFIADLPVMRQLRRHGASFTLSYEIKAFKPDRRMYEVACESLGIEPSQVLYLDDIEENVKAAKNYGLNAVRYDCSKDPPERLEEIFSSYGL